MSQVIVTNMLVILVTTKEASPVTTLTVDLEGAARMGIAEAKAHLSSLVERVEKNGEAAILERYGRPAALVVPLPRAEGAGRRARGLLAEYADEGRIGLEEGAFAGAMEAKHGSPA